MQTRRQFVFAAGGAVALLATMSWSSLRGRADTTAADKRFPLEKTDDEWRKQLTREQYQVLRGHATERAFTSPLNHEKRNGTFVCAGCAHPLFASSTKFESGTGWPSFWTPLPNAVGTEVDRSWLMIRTEVHCANCGSHLGHVFSDGPKPTGLRYCMNGVALRFVPA